MPLPFFNAGDSLYYTNQQAYDMSSGTQWGSMNIHLNQIWDDLIARRGLYDVPVYDFSNFNQYTTPTLNNPFPQIMSYTMGQLDWQNKIGGGNGLFDANGNFQAPWLQNPAQLWSSSLGWNPSASAGQGSAPKTETEEDRDFQRKYNTLLALTKQLVECEDLTRKEKDDLNSVIRNPKGNWKERYAALKKVYNEIDKDTVKEFLETAVGLGAGREINSKKSNSFYNELQAAGYEYDNSAIDKEINDLYDAISSISDNNGNPESSDILGEIQAGKSNILDVISSYNTHKKDSSTSTDKRIIDHIAKNYNAIDDDSTRETAREKVLKPIVNALLDKARDVKDDMDADSRKKVEKAISNVEDALNNSKKTIDSSLAGAFDTLYLLTRMGAMANLRNEAIAYYGEIDSEIFNKDLFADETIKDLRAEGYTQDEINKCEVKVKKEAKVEETDEEDLEVEETDENDNEEEIEENKKLNKKPVDKQVETLIAGEAIVKTIVKYSITDEEGNTKEYEVYETTKGDKKRVFIVKDDKLIELKNAKIENGKIVATTAGVQISEVEVKASEIEKAHKEAVKAEKTEEKRLEKERLESERKEKEAKEKAQETVNALVDAGILKEHTIEYENGATEQAYIETKATGSREQARPVKIDGTEIKVYNFETSKWETVADPKTYFEQEFEELTAQDIEDAKKIGEKMQDCLAGITFDGDWEEIMGSEVKDGLIDQVNAKNVLYVLKGYDAENYMADPFFEQVQDECKSNHQELTKKMAGYVAEYIQEKLESNSVPTENKKEVEKILKEFQKAATETTYYTDVDHLDENVERLFEIFNID